MLKGSRSTVNPRPGSWSTINRILAGLVAPPVCALCGGRGQWLDEPWGLDLCIHCEQACQRWQGEPLPFDAAFCLFRYRHPVDQMVTGLKFRGDLVFARVLGTLFAGALRAAGRELPECIVPLPLHRARYRERGFCQTTEIARHIAPRLRDLPGRPRVRANLLQRVRATRAQSGLSAEERTRNLQGAFAVATRIPLPRHVALLDDVMTTGHTAMAAAMALKAAGIEKVEVWCCARVAREDGADTAGGDEQHAKQDIAPPPRTAAAGPA
jgi:ComF family protein